MTPKKRVTSPAPKKLATKEAAPLLHHVSALLHTMRCIAQHEDQLCTLMHEARSAAEVSAEMRDELNTLLEELPSEEYTHDLSALREALHLSVLPSRKIAKSTKKGSSRTAAKRTPRGNAL